MQTIAFEFKQLDKLPVPESGNEFIFGKSPYGVIRCFSPVFKKGKPAFDFQLADDDWTYCHVIPKVTAAEPQFKVGDRVKFAALVFWIRGTIKAIHSDGKGNWAEVEVSDTNIQNVYLTALTLITE